MTTGSALTEKGGEVEMTDRERLIKAWKIFRDSNPYEICHGREFRAIKEPEYCMGQMIEDTIALLKEQGKSGCDGCENKNDYCEGCKLRGMPDCPRSHSEDGNFVCPNGKLSSKGGK